ncbi:MAG: preprotein translocase subunit SecE [Deltaproteobacteria bacterium]|nr:preprotein translocase subunit SecE [Deltaproteobacteria bacterium]
MAKKETEEKVGILEQGISFGNEAWLELKKVHLPSRQETMQATMVVMFMMFLFAVFLGLADYIVGNIMQATLT